MASVRAAGVGGLCLDVWRGHGIGDGRRRAICDGGRQSLSMGLRSCATAWPPHVCEYML